ncbi:hypothetical protein [Enterococcus lactis]|uniref:hypothetical protein n=1 Tax=Enterococcus lactis TaxID=357441 RepID=UPI0039A45699
MRFLDEVIFEKDGEGNRYDPELGEWIEEAPITVTTNANVTDLGTDRSVAIFGDIRQGSKVIRTMPLFVVPKYDRIIFNGKTYKDVAQRSLLSTNSIIVQEVIAK